MTGQAPRGRGHRYPLHELEALIGWPTAYELAEDQQPWYPAGTPESELRPKRERPTYGLGSVAELCERASRRRFQDA